MSRDQLLNKVIVEYLQGGSKWKQTIKNHVKQKEFANNEELMDRIHCLTGNFSN